VTATDAALNASLTPSDGGFIVGDGTDFVVETGATARTSMGLGSIATQSSAAVSITGGAISGITDLAVTDGGTGASNAADARTNLGLAIGSNVQAYDATLLSLAALGTAANKMAYTTAADTWAEADITAAGRALLDDASTSDQRTTLGLAIGTNVQGYSSKLDDIVSRYTKEATTTGSSLYFVEGTDNGTNKVTLQAPATIPSDVIFTLPSTNGTADYVLKTDGSGVTSWVAQTGGGTVSPLTTKGDVYVFGTANDRLPVGTDNYVLTADSAQALGVKWAAAGAGSGTSLTKAITQASHGFAVGDLLYLVGGVYTKAIATSAAAAEVIGIVSAVAGGTDDFTLQFAGRVTGLSGLTAGAVYFLSPTTAGTATATEPTTATQVSKPVYVADTTTTAYLALESRGYTVGSTAAVQDNMILLATATASNSATIEFNALFSSAYREYIFLFERLIPATNSVSLYSQIGTGATPTYKTSGYFYNSTSGLTSAVEEYSASDSTIKITPAAAPEYSSSGVGISGRFNLYGCSASSTPAQGRWNVAGNYSTSPYYTVTVDGSFKIAADTFTAIKFYFSSGNVASGKIYMYGIKG
jgi:hypothetical protein